MERNQGRSYPGLQVSETQQRRNNGDVPGLNSPASGGLKGMVAARGRLNKGEAGKRIKCSESVTLRRRCCWPRCTLYMCVYPCRGGGGEHETLAWPSCRARGGRHCEFVREAKRDEERGSAAAGWLDASCGDRSLVSARPGIPGWASKYVHCTEYISTY